MALSWFYVSSLFYNPPSTEIQPDRHLYRGESFGVFFAFGVNSSFGFYLDSFGFIGRHGLLSGNTSDEMFIFNIFIVGEEFIEYCIKCVEFLLFAFFDCLLGLNWRCSLTYLLLFDVRGSRQQVQWVLLIISYWNPWIFLFFLFFKCNNECQNHPTSLNVDISNIWCMLITFTPIPFLNEHSTI